MKPHKDLPSGSQPWANEVDQLMAEVKALREVVRRLTENAGIDFANPKRGVNAGNTPSVQNPVGQKLSSLADVKTYDVLDGQVLSWSQQGQKWLPVTPLAGGAVEIPMAYSNSYLHTAMGYGNLTGADSGHWAYFATNDSGFGQRYAELWSTSEVYIGAGNSESGPVSLIDVTYDGFGRPYVQISAEDYADGSYGSMTIGSYFIRMDVPAFQNPRTDTATRRVFDGPAYADEGHQTYDRDLKIPIWWNGTTWVNALGTAV